MNSARLLQIRCTTAVTHVYSGLHVDQEEFFFAGRPSKAYTIAAQWKSCPRRCTAPLANICRARRRSRPYASFEKTVLRRTGFKRRATCSAGELRESWKRGQTVASNVLEVLFRSPPMFSLVQGFYEELTAVRERKLALLGVEFAGKSSILEWLKAFLSKDVSRGATVPKPSALDKMSPTVGLNVAKLRTAGEKLLLWDLGGQKALRPIWERYVNEAEAIIWVVDSCDEERLVDSRDSLKKLLTRPHLTHSPLLVYANKQDADAAIDPVTVSLALDLIADAEKRSHCIQPCSAESGEGIREGLEWLMSSLQGDTKLEMRIP